MLHVSALPKGHDQAMRNKTANNNINSCIQMESKYEYFISLPVITESNYEPHLVVYLQFHY